MDARRKAYLDAMGIDLWVPREPGGREPAPAAVVELPAAEPVPIPAETPAMAAAPLTEAVPGWDELAEQVRACHACAELVANRSQTVFGVGNRQAELMVIGEAPGVDEDRQGEPFVGRAGQLLNQMLKAIGFERPTVFIANVLKCRPPNNRDPRPEEAQACAAFLQAQIELVNPRAILVVGRIAAQSLLGTDQAIGKLRGSVHRLGSRPLVVTYHPAYLLRSPGEKRKAWEDLKLALRTLRGEG